MKIAFRTNATVMRIRTMWGDIKITVPPSDDFALSGGRSFFFFFFHACLCFHKRARRCLVWRCVPKWMWHLAKSRLIWHQENVRGAARAREMSPCGGSVVRRSPGLARSHVSMDAHMTLCNVHTQYCTYVCAQMGRKKYGRSVPLVFSNLYLNILRLTYTHTHTTVSCRPSSAPLNFFPRHLSANVLRTCV